jgi:hypothetical protein
MKLLNTSQLPSGCSILKEIDYDFEQQKLFIVVSESEIFFIKKVPSPYPQQEDEPGGILIYQTEFPRSASKWIVNAIENQLWRSEKEGGLPSGVNHVEGDFEGDHLKIRRSMNVGGPGVKGFLLMNLSRPHRTLKSKKYQEIQLSDALFKDHILDILKNL